MSYLVRLQNFFMKHDPDRLYLAKRIARAFRNDEDAVMNRLEEIYIKGGPEKLKVKEIIASKKTSSKPSEISEDIDKDDVSNPIENELKPKKSKKKLFIAVGLVLALAGAGAGYYMSMGESTSNDLETHKSDSTHQKQITEPKTVEEVEEAIDQAEKDSVAKDLIEAGEIIEILH